VNVGLYFDCRNPPRWHRPWPAVYGKVLELAEQAERLDAHSVWVTEHHLFEDGYLPQPLTFAAAIAARTKRIRIGTAIIIAPLHHPVELAEQAAVVDILSGGRLDLGLGAGYLDGEYELFGADPSRKGGATFDTVSELRRIWWEGGVTPPPVQDPLPIWIGPRSAKNAHRTGVVGEGLLRVAPELVEPYLQGLEEGGHGRGAARMAGPVNCFLSDDPERDWPRVAPHVAYQWGSYAVYRDGIGFDEALAATDPDDWRARGITQGTTSGFLFGTPEHAAEQIRDFVGDVRVETIFVWGALAGVDDDLAERNVELVCTRLTPLLAG
jgi:alkanesulfonate monooxygenase SsuD/methylene tetrahydromethanopterin reductase-like flavin-dependent oxidoreductase (luciferase family)